MWRFAQIDHEMINDSYQSTMRSVSRPTLDRGTDRVLIVVLSSLYYYGLAIITYWRLERVVEACCGPHIPYHFLIQASHFIRVSRCISYLSKVKKCQGKISKFETIPGLCPLPPTPHHNQENQFNQFNVSLLQNKTCTYSTIMIQLKLWTRISSNRFYISKL